MNVRTILDKVFLSSSNTVFRDEYSAVKRCAPHLLDVDSSEVSSEFYDLAEYVHKVFLGLESNDLLFY